MVRVFVRHPVAEFEVWKQAYDAFDAERQGMGVLDQAAHQALDNPNEVTIWHDFASVDAAQAFLSSDRLAEVMGSAGVAGEPTIWLTTPA